MMGTIKFPCIQKKVYTQCVSARLRTRVSKLLGDSGKASTKKNLKGMDWPIFYDISSRCYLVVQLICNRSMVYNLKCI